MTRDRLGASLGLVLFIGCGGGAAAPRGTPDAGSPLPDGSSPSIDVGSSPSVDVTPDPAICVDQEGSDAGPGLATETMPWTVVTATDGGATGSPGSDADITADAGEPSGCTLVPPGGLGPQWSELFGPRCRGTAMVRRAGAAPEMVLADGSVLRWEASAKIPAVGPPTLAIGQTVSIAYSRVVIWTCPFCGYTTTSELTIRVAEGGPIIWFGRAGQGDLDGDVIRHLFGVGAHKQLFCRQAIQHTCWEVERDMFDLIVESTPPQLISHLGRREITTPNGHYDVFWAGGRELLTSSKNNCSDLPAFGSVSDFAAVPVPPAGN